MFRRLVVSVALVCGLPALAWTGNHSHPAAYTVIDFGVDVQITDIDEDNTVVGVVKDSLTALDAAVTLWPRRQAFAVLSGRPVTQVQARRRGVSVGYIDFAPGDIATNPHAALWEKDGPVQDLGTLAGPRLSSRAEGVTPGLVVGECTTPDGRDLPCTWTRRRGQWSAAQPLPTLGGPNGFAGAVNRHGVMGGASDTTMTHDVFGTIFYDMHATLWIDRVPVDIDPTGGGFSAVLGLTSHNLAVGEASFPALGFLDTRPFVWTQTTGIQPLPLLKADSHGSAQAVSDEKKPTIVGQSCYPGPSDYVCTAVRWTLDRHERWQVEDLQPLVADFGMPLRLATAVNAHGLIAAVTDAPWWSGLRAHAVLLVPGGGQEAVADAADEEEN